MKKLILISILLGSLLLWVQMLSAEPAVPTAPAKPEAPKTMKSVLDFEMKRIDGSTQKLSDYKGKVLLIVNTASKCGLTYQYEGLQKLYSQYKDRCFVVLGFPSNDFGAQEPGTETEIKSFCTTTYGVDFPMFSKISVKKGENQSPLYTYLTEKETNPDFSGKISWNFNKFLIGKDGTVLNRFGSRVKPSDSKLTEAINSALGQR